jgi:glycosyltransferase involved in cell wall biosynthesis
VESSTNGTSPQSDPSSRIIFLGGLHWPPNAQGVLWFFKEIFPLIKQELPEASLTVIGKDPPFELNGNGVQVTGYVPDLAPYLAETAVFIVPLLAGGGMRVKILDAWNWGLPIVSTTIGAEGIAAVDQENMLIADTPEAFAKATISLLQRPDLAKKLVQNGRQTLEEEYDWQTVYRAWDKIYPND